MPESRQVLVVAVGDEADSLEELLGGAGYRVRRAADVRSAQAHVRAMVAPALVVIQGMAELDLVTFLTALRRLRPADFHQVPVILLHDGSDAAPVGVSEIMPFEPPLLLEAAQRLLEQVD